MIIPRNLNLDWLHQATETVVYGKYRHRRQGSTVAYMMLMIGEVELGGDHNTYLYVGHDSRFTTIVECDFLMLIKKLLPGVPVTTVAKNRITIGGTQTFLFYPIDQLISQPTLIRDWSLDRVFMDVSDAKLASLDINGELTDMYQRLLTQLSYRRGDVI